MNDTAEVKKIWGMERREAVQNILWLFLFVGLMVAASFFIGIEEMSALVARAGFWGPLLLIVLKASTIVFAPLSGSPLYPLSGVLFGGWFGLLYIVLGDMLGAVISFMISRRYGKKMVARFLSASNLKFLDTALSYMSSVKGFLIMRVIFSPLPEVASYGAGLTAIPFWPFFFIHSTVGLVPAAILVWFGARLSLSSGPFGLLAILLVGSAAAGIGAYIFFRFVQPRALVAARQEEEKVD